MLNGKCSIILYFCKVKHLRTLFPLFVLLSVMVMVAGCSVSRFIPEGEYLLNDVKIRADEKGVSPSQMQGYVQQHPNSRWFSAVKVPMAPYLLSGRDTTKRINRFLVFACLLQTYCFLVFFFIPEVANMIVIINSS